jgi:hypothetical protein
VARERFNRTRLAHATSQLRTEAHLRNACVAIVVIEAAAGVVTPTQSRRIHMPRQIAAVMVGSIIAVVVIYALFDERVSFKKIVATSPTVQSHNN